MPPKRQKPANFGMCGCSRRVSWSATECILKPLDARVKLGFHVAAASGPTQHEVPSLTEEVGKEFFARLTLRLNEECRRFIEPVALIHVRSYRRIVVARGQKLRHSSLRLSCLDLHCLSSLEGLASLLEGGHAYGERGLPCLVLLPG